jgi:Protein of unknown function (DUF2911)
MDRESATHSKEETVTQRSNVTWPAVALAGALLACAVMSAQDKRPLSPRGSAAAHVGGTWTNVGSRTFVVGGGTYEGAKWIEITSGRPLKRGRDIFGSGADYGKATLIGAPIWRAGADVSTQLKTEVPLKIGTGTVPAGEYTLFVDLKQNDWTFVVSRWPAQQTYDPNNKTALWGAYGYTPDKDVLRAKMKIETLPHSHEQLTWEFLDVTKTGGAIGLTWDKTLALVPFSVGAGT